MGRSHLHSFFHSRLLPAPGPVPRWERPTPKWYAHPVPYFQADACGSGGLHTGRGVHLPEGELRAEALTGLGSRLRAIWAENPKVLGPWNLI